MTFLRLAAFGLAATLAAAPVALARDHHHHHSGTGHGDMPMITTDTTGWLDLGIDITQAGSTPANVARFLDSLPAPQREQLVAACHERVADPSWHQPSIVSFCRTVINL